METETTDKRRADYSRRRETPNAVFPPIPVQPLSLSSPPLSAGHCFNSRGGRLTVIMASQEIKTMENGPDGYVAEQDQDGKDLDLGEQIDPFGSEETAEIKYKTLTWW